MPQVGKLIQLDWSERAAEARVIARKYKGNDNHIVETMLEIAKAYDGLAHRRHARAKLKPLDDKATSPPGGSKRIGRRLKAIREDRGRSQGWLARETGKSRKTISAYENGGIRLNHEFTELAARALHCQPADFLTLVDSPPPPLRRYHAPRRRKQVA